MNLSKQRRNRGVVLTPIGLQKLADAKAKLEIAENYGNRLTFEDWSDRVQLSARTIARIFDAHQGVDRRSIELFFTALNLKLEKQDYTREAPEPENHDSGVANTRWDWGEAVDVPVLFGRTEELSKLKHWILNQHCRLVAILGMGGIGKTALAVKLASQVQNEFEYLIWRSLRDAPPVQDIIDELVQFLCQGQQLESCSDTKAKMSHLLKCLRDKRCLLVLDNAESLLCEGEYAGNYRAGCEGYGELLRRLGEERHSSCVVLTSREKPREVALLEGIDTSVRSFTLGGLEQAAAQQLCQSQGNFVGKPEHWQIAIEHYRGNPLALRIVAAGIREYLGGDVAAFLDYVRQGGLVFGDIQDLLERQFHRLTQLEQQVMYWLAVHREGVTLQQLHSDLMTLVSPPQLLSAMQSLGRRSLIETSGIGFTLQPVVMEYATQRLVAHLVEEIASNKPKWLQSVALLVAQGKDYIKEVQRRLILKPVAQELIAQLGSSEVIAEHLRQMLARQREGARLEPNYKAGNILNLLIHLGVDLRGYDFSQLSVWQADLRMVDLPQVNFAQADLSKSVFTETLDCTVSLSFSRDGELLASGDMKGEIRVYQVASGRQLFTSRGHINYAYVAFHPNGQVVASASPETAIRLWDIHTGQCIKTMHSHTGYFSILFSPDGGILASGCHDNTIKLWDVSTGECLKTLQGHTNAIWSVAFSPDAQTLASGSWDTTIKLWDVSTGQCLQTLQEHVSPARIVAFSPDGRFLASSSDDGTVRLWEVSTGQCLKILSGHGEAVWSVAFSPDGQTLVSSSWDQTVKLWDVSTGQCLKTLQGHTSLIRTVLFSPNGDLIASGGDDHTIRLWDASTGYCLKTLQGYGFRVWSLASSCTGQILASGGEDRIVRLWDVSTGQVLRTLHGHHSTVRAVALSPDGQTLASGSDDQSVKLWNVDNGQCYRTLTGHAGWVWSVAFSPDGCTLASGSYDQTAKLWDLHTGQCRKTLQAEGHGVLAIAFSPDGKVLVSGGTDAAVKFWDASTGECLRTLLGHSSWTWTLAFSPDGQILASGGVEGAIKLWDVSTGQCLHTLPGEMVLVYSIVFSPDGKTLISAHMDKTLKFWDVRTGQCYQVWQAHSNEVSSVVFASDGQILVSGGEDGTIKFWDFKTGECIRILKSDGPYAGMNISGATGLTEAQKATLKTLGAVE